MKKVLVATVILVNNNSKFLMEIKKTNSKFTNLWQFPGGKVEPHELVLHAAIRELKEELSISINPYDLKPLSFFEYVKNSCQYIIFYYICKRWDGVILNQESQMLSWFSIEQVKDVKTIDYNKLILSTLSEILKNN